MSSAVPNTIDQFMAIVTAVLPSDAQVWFGKPLSKYIANTTLQITGVQNGRQEPAEMSPEYRREEEFDLVCQLTYWEGDLDFVGAKDQVYATFSLITVAVANNPTLNGAVRFAQPRQFDFTPDSTPDGFTIGVLNFTLNCQARIASLT
jgi:hypothetical protein